MNIRTHRSTVLGALRATLGLLLATIVVIGLSVVVSQPASAAPVPPGNVTVDATQAGSPRAQWSHVPGATAYDVEVSAAGDIIEKVRTTNIQYVPTKPLPVATENHSVTIEFRVRSVDASGVSDASDPASFNPALSAVPALVTPSNDDEFSAPTGVPLLTWSTVRGATGYVVQVGTDDQFSPGSYSATTVSSTSLTFRGTHDQQYHWRVHAQYATGIVGAFSEVRSFSTFGVPTIAVDTASPQHSENSGGYVEDAVFDWDAVPGAVSYDLEVDNDTTPGDAVTLSRSAILSTRFAANVPNDQYYWRVRSADAYGVKSDWSQYLIMRRAWPRQPHLQWPPAQAAGDPAIGGPFYYQWTPVRLASRYEVQLASDENFQNIVDRCSTPHTTYVPTSGEQCWPTHGAVRYWRVKAYDGDDIITDVISAEHHRFVYDTWSVSGLSPVDGSSGDTPTLTWTPLAGASSYRVQIVNSTTGAEVENVITRTAAYTPRANLLANVNSPATYRWHVTPMSETRNGNGLLPAAQPRFTVTGSGGGTALSPEPTSPPTSSVHPRFPTLSWTPMAVGVDAVGKTTPPKYRVFIRPAGTLTWPAAPLAQTVQSRLEDTGVGNLAHGAYEWRVESVVGTTTTPGSTGTFTIGSLPAVTGHRVALQGDALWGPGADSDTSCGREQCEALPETPILAWDPNPNTGLYRVTISYDAELTNLVSTTLIEGTALLVTTSLPDSQAGAPYYWQVQPCTTPTRCTPLTHARYAFEKRTNKAVPTSPVGTDESPGQVTDDLTLNWEDYFQTNLGVANPHATTGVSTTARFEAARYRVQVSPHKSFSSVYDNAVVEQTQYTSPDKTYPEGLLYWRVQAIDASGNSLPWSEVQTVEKRSPRIETTLPSDNGTITTPAFTWEPLAYAASYDLEVYKNGDQLASPGNKVVGVNTKLAAYSHADPLPVSSTPYVWRVRRVDATGRKGPWSAESPELMPSFTVLGASPDYATPTSGDRIEPNGSLFTWTQPTSGRQPASHRFEWRRPGIASAITAVATVADAYAPLKPFADGEWEWRVVSLDAKGAVVGATKAVGEAWRTFTTSSKPTATAKPVIEGDGSVGSVLHALAATWDMPGVTEHWQWLRNGSAITDATSQDYTVTNVDVGKVITVRVTGQKAGYANGTVTSDPISGTVGPAPTATTNPEITGPATVGSVLTLTSGEWSLPDVVESYQWYRGDTTAISKATGKTYTVALADVGQDIHVVVTGRRAGYTNAVVLTNKVRAVAAGAPVLVAAPTISGTRSVGSDLKATGGTWKTSSGTAVVPTFSYQWFRNGAPIANAVASTYRLVISDAGRSVSVQVTARVPGANDGTANSAVATIAKLRSTAKVVATARVRTTQRATIRITVTVAGGVRPSGTVRFYDRLGSRAERQIKVVSMTTSAAGRVTIKMVLKGRGTHRVRATYGGSSTIATSRSASVRVIVQ